ncbi:putative carboxypeptidase A2-like [Apostichopus japonicus]|uniref:Putative carboxypeptidase A2-like n=1 Tax=Stichopus japonicus TaxID=307972 RepID=A0A2G8LQJ2_STIJA|nr:putative carboxypeptidase A2-like [Apostichopus japonicus]
MKFSVVVTMLFAALCAGKKSYDGYSVYRITPRTEHAGNVIQELSENVNFGQSLDFWHESRNLGDPTDVMVPPRYKALVEDFLRRRHMEFSLLVENVEDVIYPQAGGCGTDSTDPAFYNCYHTMDEIESWMDGIVASYPGIASKEAVSATFEGRTVSAIKISGPNADRPAVIFQGGIHAREWISPATMMNIAKMLLDDYGVDTEVTAIIEHYDIYIIPVLNQDGYAYTWTDDRMWRKNRRTPSSGRCYGVDLNRNWDVDFGGELTFTFET